MSENIHIKSDGIIEAARAQAVVEARQQLKTEGRILSASAVATAMPSEIFSGEVRYVGRVKFECLMLVDGAVECVSAIAEFSDKIVSPTIVAGMSVVLAPEVINVEATVDGGTLKAVAVVDTTALAVLSTELSCISAPDEGIYAERRAINYDTVVAVERETVYVTDSIGADKAADVVGVASRTVITNAETGTGEVKIAGAVYSFVTVKTDDGMLGARRIVTPFVKSIAVSGVAAGDCAFAVAAVAESTANIAGGDRLELAATVNIAVIVVSNKTVDAVADVFSAAAQLEKSCAVLKCHSLEPLATVIDTVDGQIPLPTDRPAADSVLCVAGSFCELSQTTLAGGKVTVEGLVGGDIIYYNAEHNTVDALAFRLPFSAPLAVHTAAQSVSASAVVSDVGVRVRRESVFDIKAEIAFTLRLSSETECECVTAVAVGEPIERPDASVIIHIAKPGETLWQAARALCCAPERVCKQNAAQPPYSGGEKLINFCDGK